MKKIQRTGDNIDKIIADFCGEHKIKDWELKCKVIKKPSKGFLGLFGNKTAIVSFELPEIGERAGLFMEKLLEKLGIPYESVNAKTEGKNVYLEIVGSKDTGFLIGKSGSMLETLQYLINRVYESDRNLDRIFIDVEGYRERREATFLRQFLPIIKKVREQGKPYTLDPMKASERRVIHRHIERDRGLRTLTIGEGEKKRIVIFSAKQSESEILNQTQNKRPRRNPRKSSDRKR